MVQVSDATDQGRYEVIWLNLLPMMSSIEVFASHDGQTAVVLFVGCLLYVLATC